MIERRSNPDGPSVSSASGRLLEVDGRWFRDLAGTGDLVPWADWRSDPVKRARALASELPIEVIAGLMLYSPHQLVPAPVDGPFPGTYGGEAFDADRHERAALTDEQRALLERDHIRHVLVVGFADLDAAIEWNTRVQALAESLPFSIPVNVSSDPRHGYSESGAEYKSVGVAVSQWPEGIGLASVGSIEVVRQFADAVRQEYRALGVTTALGPQVDLATEPRWMRAVDTFGGDVEQVVAFTKAYVDTLQTTPGAPAGWGRGSVIAMVKHWPGGGTGEGGRDSHYRFGMYNVYPGGNAAEHLRPFTEGAFALDGPTGSAGAVMPYYSVSVGLSEEPVGNAYSAEVMGQLRNEYGYEGVVCTDWGITADASGNLEGFESRCFGVDDLPEAERHLRIIDNGADQFGGNSDVAPVLEAYRLGCERVGEPAMRARFEESATRLLTGMFRVGLFDDPFLDPEASRATVGRPDLVEAGYSAQLRSIVRLKGAGTLAARGSSVWVPRRHVDAHKGFFRQPLPAADLDALDPAVVAEYYRVVDDPTDADVALVVLHSPLSDPLVDGQFRPISLQYGPYRADHARPLALAGDRAYPGREAVVANASDLDLLREARAAMAGRPVVVVVQLDTPVVMGEVEPEADQLFVHFGVSQRAVLDVVCGDRVAGGRLPYTLPLDMTTIEASSEDVFDDYEPYVATDGSTYGLGFALVSRAPDGA